MGKRGVRRWIGGRGVSANVTRESRLEDRVVCFIRRCTDVVILRSELAKLGSKSRLTRVLARLVEARTLVRVGHGVYVKTRWNKFTRELAPAGTFEQIAAEAFRKLGIDIGHGLLAREYNSGLTSQVPMTGVVTAGQRRIRRRIQVGSRVVKYERDGVKQPR